MLTFLSLLLTFLLVCSQSYAQFITSTRFQPCTSTTHTSSHATVTDEPKVEVRALNSICGYYSTWISTWTTRTIACPSGVPCAFGSVSGLPNQVFGYCSTANAQPVTVAFDYGSGPAAGCGPAQLCCDSKLPAYGTYTFNNGASSLIDCDTSRFWLAAVATISSSSSTSTVSSTTSSTTAATSPTSTNGAISGTGKLTTGNILTIVFSVLGGTGAFAGGLIAVIRYIRHRRGGSGGDDGGPASNTVTYRTGTDRGQTNHHYHFHDRVNVLVHDSQLYVNGGRGGLGSQMSLSGYGRAPQIGGGSSSRLLRN